MSVAPKSSLGVRGLIVLVMALVVALPQTATADTAPPRTHHVIVIGDSLTFGADYFGKLGRRISATNRWRSVKVHAVVGMTTKDGIKALSRMRIPEPATIVVALGTNDMLSQRSRSYPPLAIDRFMRAAGGRQVLWMNVEFSVTRRDWRSRGGRFNTELRRAQTRWPNLRVADWSTFFEPKGKSRFISDGIHLTVSGYKTRANYVMAELKKWAMFLDQSVATTTTLPDETSTTVDPSATTSSIAAVP